MKWSVSVRMVQISKRPDFIFMYLIDELMIPYFGRNRAKQFVSGKPIRFGHKIWALTTPSGYLPFRALRCHPELKLKLIPPQCQAVWVLEP